MSTEIPPSSSDLSTKAQKQFDALGGAPAAIRPESSQPQLPPGREFNLVVCGTTKLYPDYWMFADTMGFIAELKAKGAAADCFSCFPAVEYFERVRQTNNMDEMKFGKHGDNKEALWIFSRGDFLKNEKNEAHWYQQVDPKDLLSKVQWWFGKVAESIQPNDVVNIFLSAHGEPDTGDMIFGDNWFTVEELLTHVAKFGDDVGVNIIVSSCHSGFVVEAFAKSNQRNRYVAACSGKDTRGFSMTRSPSDRLRCGRFANAFVESMGQHGLNLPSPEDWTLQKHHDYIKKQMRNITPDWPVEIIDPTFHTDHNLNTPLNQIIHRPESKHVTRLPIRQDEPATKWPKLNTIFGQQLSKQVKELIIPDGIVVASAEAIKVIKSEGSRCNIRLGYPPDLGVYEYLIHASPRWEFLLTNLYWRAFRQAAVWKLFCHLLRKGFVNLDTLTAPMDLFGNTEQIMLIFYGLACFPFVRKLRTESMLAGIPCQTSSWCTDTYWLSIVISRHGANIPHLFSEIEQYGIFGELDEKLYASFKEKLPSSMEIPAIERDGERPAIVRGRKRPEGYVDKTIFGVWLPHGLSADPAQRHRELEAHIKRGNDIIRCYESMIGEHCQLEISIMVFDADGEESGGEFPAVRVSLAPSELRVPKTTSVKYDDESSSSSGTEFEVMPFN